MVWEKEGACKAQGLEPLQASPRIQAMHPPRTSLQPLAAFFVLLLGMAPLAAQDKEDPFGSLFGDRQEGAEEELPSDPLEQARTLLARGRHGEARELLLAILGEDPADEAAWICRARLELKEGRAEEAARCGEALLELQPDKPAGHLILGILAERRGAVAQALERFSFAAAFARRGREAPSRPRRPCARCSTTTIVTTPWGPGSWCGSVGPAGVWTCSPT